MITKEGKIEFVFQEMDAKSAAMFFEYYDFVNAEFALEYGITELKPLELRQCRYCNKSSPQVTFNNIAHSIPEFLGNQSAVSDYECDSCNKQFGKLEKQLANFIGHQTTLLNIKGKKKVPTSISHDNKTIAKPAKLFSKYEIIEFGDNTNESLSTKLNPYDGTIEISFVTQPFIPYSIYRCFLKFALSLLPSEKCSSYRIAFDILSDVHNRKFVENSHHVLRVTRIDSVFCYTGILLFESKEKYKRKVPPLSLVLFFGNFMYQIYVPYTNEYLPISKNEIVSCPCLPPVIMSDKIANLKYDVEFIDLDSINQLTRTLLTKMKVAFNEQDLISIDLDSGKQTEFKFNPANISKIALVKKGTKIEIYKDNS